MPAGEGPFPTIMETHGGYLTLQALGKRPDLWAGGLAGGAIADWRLSVEDASDTLRAIFVAWLGGTPARPIEEYEARMRELGKPIEVHWFDAGHGSYVTQRQIEHYQLMLEFAYRILSRPAARAVSR